VLPVISAFMSRGVPEGEPVVLDVAQLEALLSRTFGIGLDAGRGKEPVALVRLRLARALLGAAEANAAAEGLALHAARRRLDVPRWWNSIPGVLRDPLAGRRRFEIPTHLPYSTSARHAPFQVPSSGAGATATVR